MSQAPVDDFLAEIQTHLIQSLENRWMELTGSLSYADEQNADFFERTTGFLKDLAQDFKKAELPPWESFLEQGAFALLDPRFQTQWKSLQIEQREPLWQKIALLFCTPAKDFALGNSQSLPNPLEAILSLFQTNPLSAGSDLFLVCHIGSRNFAVPIRQVTEIQVLKKFTLLPTEEKEIKGLMSNRGEVIPVLSLHELHDSPESAKEYVVICEQKQHKFGFTVSSTDQVTSLDRSKFEPAQAVMGGITTNYIHHFTVINKNIYLILEPEKMIS